MEEEVEGMANARLLHKKISRSEQVNDLSDRAALLYTWGIPHTDDFGRMDGRPRIVRATIMPLKEWTDAEVALYLHEMHDQGLIHYYEASGIKIVQYTGFEQNQSGLHKRTRSNYPAPPDVCADIPGSSGKAQGSSSEFPPESESESEEELSSQLPFEGETSFTEETTEYRLACLLRSRILANLPNAKVPRDAPTAMAKWSLAVDRMVRIDKRDPTDIEWIITWCQNDDFWQSNILSTDKLRKQFDVLMLRSGRNTRTRPPTARPAPAEDDVARRLRELGV